MRIVVVGTGYVGAVCAACLAECGHEVVGLDTNPDKVAALSRGDTLLFEPGLKDLIRMGLRLGRLRFTTEYPEAVRFAETVFLTVDTPTGEDGSADLTRILNAAGSVAANMDGYRLIVLKSTVPVGTHKRVKARIAETWRGDFSLACNPEFLKEGSAVDDFQRPDRIVVGADDERAFAAMRLLYEPFVRSGAPILCMDPESAELTKYASNAFLAARISFMNEIARLCEAVGADVENVRKGMACDARIGRRFLFPGMGFGGSCFPKDLRALVATGRACGQPMRIADAVLAVNEGQKLWFLPRLRREFGGSLAGRTVCLWGLAFKPKTDDLREAPAIALAEALVREGAAVRAFDPVANENAKRLLGAGATVCDSAYEAAAGADALVLATEWVEFRVPDLRRLASEMRGRLIFDGRNVLDPAAVRAAGFEYVGIGRR